MQVRWSEQAHVYNEVLVEVSNFAAASTSRNAGLEARHKPVHESQKSKQNDRNPQRKKLEHTTTGCV